MNESRGTDAVESILLQYIERFGLTDKARKYFHESREKDSNKTPIKREKAIKAE